MQRFAGEIFPNFRSQRLNAPLNPASVIKTLTRSAASWCFAARLFLRWGILFLEFLERGTETLTHARAAEQGTLVNAPLVERLYGLNLSCLVSGQRLNWRLDTILGAWRTLKLLLRARRSFHRVSLQCM